MLNLRIFFVYAMMACAAHAAVKGNWKRHIIWEGLHNNVAVAADFTGDGKIDVISNAGSVTRLFVAPDWNQFIIGSHKDHTFIHGETFDVDNAGGLNQRRPLVFQGDQVYIGKAGDPYIGPTVTDITVKSDKGPVYLSLKATGTVTFFNAGVTKYLIADEMKKFNTVKNPQGKALLKMLGLN